MREAKKVFLLRNFEIENIAKILGRLGVHPVGIDIMRKKFRFCVFYITGLTSAECNILKQEALSCGAEAAVPKGSVECKVKSGDVLLSGTEKELRLLSQKLLLEPFFLKEIGKEIENVLSENRRPVFRISGEKILTTDKHPLIMGILNTTPDSFSDGGKYLNTDEAIRHGIRLSEEGADIIDIGGESTRPGSKGVSAKEEMMRVIPVIKSLAKKIKIPISIDTTKSEVAKAALDNGASIINDISGLVFDRNIGKVAARYNSGLILMHTRGRPNTMQRGEISYTNLLLDITLYLERSITAALEMGVNFENIAIDPGIGFGKTPEQNIEIIRNVLAFRRLKRPVLIGASRKSFLGYITGREVSDREFATTAIHSILAIKGADILRVHNVKAALDAIKVGKAAV